MQRDISEISAHLRRLDARGNAGKNWLGSLKDSIEAESSATRTRLIRWMVGGMFVETAAVLAIARYVH